MNLYIKGTVKLTLKFLIVDVSQVQLFGAS